MTDSKLVTIRSFTNAGEAAVTRSLLESAGIRVFTKGELWNDIYPVGSTWTEIDLQVSEENVELAQELLSAGFDREEFREESTRKDDPER